MSFTFQITLGILLGSDYSAGVHRLGQVNVDYASLLKQSPKFLSHFPSISITMNMWIANAITSCPLVYRNQLVRL